VSPPFSGYSTTPLPLRTHEPRRSDLLYTLVKVLVFLTAPVGGSMKHMTRHWQWTRDSVAAMTREPLFLPSLVAMVRPALDVLSGTRERSERDMNSLDLLLTLLKQCLEVPNGNSGQVTGVLEGFLLALDAQRVWDVVAALCKLVNRREFRRLAVLLLDFAFQAFRGQRAEDIVRAGNNVVKPLLLLSSAGGGSGGALGRPFTTLPSAAVDSRPHAALSRVPQLQSYRDAVEAAASTASESAAASKAAHAAVNAVYAAGSPPRSHEPRRPPVGTPGHAAGGAGDGTGGGGHAAALFSAVRSRTGAATPFAKVRIGVADEEEDELIAAEAGGAGAATGGVALFGADGGSGGGRAPGAVSALLSKSGKSDLTRLKGDPAFQFVLRQRKAQVARQLPLTRHARFGTITSVKTMGVQRMLPVVTAGASIGAAASSGAARRYHPDFKSHRGGFSRSKNDDAPPPVYIDTSTGVGAWQPDPSGASTVFHASVATVEAAHACLFFAARQLLHMAVPPPLPKVRHRKADRDGDSDSDSSVGSGGDDGSPRRDADVADDVAAEEEGDVLPAISAFGVLTEALKLKIGRDSEDVTQADKLKYLHLTGVLLGVYRVAEVARIRSDVAAARDWWAANPSAAAESSGPAFAMSTRATRRDVSPPRPSQPLATPAGSSPPSQLPGGAGSSVASAVTMPTVIPGLSTGPVVNLLDRWSTARLSEWGSEALDRKHWISVSVVVCESLPTIAGAPIAPP